ncbi:MAG: hypothetical protein EOM52_10790 [Clostridia bacterium]|nr:hypothetical protein [Clostridia bacterium]
MAEAARRFAKLVLELLLTLLEDGGTILSGQDGGDFLRSKTGLAEGYDALERQELPGGVEPIADTSASRPSW